jgi:hypothetical protein
MSTIKTVGELRAVIADLPDDMPLTGYNGSDGHKLISWWTGDVYRTFIDEDATDPEELIEVLTLSTD